MGRAQITRFDPIRLGGHEHSAWVGYYRRDWRLVLRSAYGMVSSGFGLSRLQGVRGAWYVLRANQAWAPYTENDPQRARELMRRCYTLVARVHDLPIDPRRVALLEVDWWREHRTLQRATPDGTVDDTALVDALTALYAYVYDVAPETVRPAAQLRSTAMQLSDAWVERGCDLGDPSLREQQRTLAASYTRLRQAVEPAPG